MRVVRDPKLVDRKEWSDFVKKNEYGNIFQAPEMYDVYRDTKYYTPLFVSVINDKNQIEGVLLAVVQSEKFRI